MPNIVEIIYKTIAKRMPYTLTFYQTDILPLLFHHLETNARECNLGDSQVFFDQHRTTAAPSVAPQHQLYQTVPSELQPFTFYLRDELLVVRFFAAKNHICHQKLE